MRNMSGFNGFNGNQSIIGNLAGAQKSYVLPKNAYASSKISDVKPKSIEG